MSGNLKQAELAFGGTNASNKANVGAKRSASSSSGPAKKKLKTGKKKSGDEDEPPHVETGKKQQAVLSESTATRWLHKHDLQADLQRKFSEKFTTNTTTVCDGGKDVEVLAMRDGKPVSTDESGYPRIKLNFSEGPRNPDSGKIQKIQIRVHTLKKYLELWEKVKAKEPLDSKERIWYLAHSRGTDEDIQALKDTPLEVSHYFASRKDSVGYWIEEKKKNQGRANDVHCFDRLICGVCNHKTIFPCTHVPRCQDDHVGCCEGCREDSA